MIYTGINGYLDDLEVSDVKNYSAALLNYLKTSKTAYGEAVASSQAFSDETENLLLSAISESKENFKASLS